MKIQIVGSLALILLLLSLSITVDAGKDYSSNLKKGQSATELISTVFSLLKDEVTSRGLARLDASLKSVLGGHLTGLVYAASVAVGVITLLAFYESPISPLPVPSLPKPPVGRFPPEHAVWPPVSKHPVKAGPGYAGAASSQQFQFALPQSIDKIPNAGAYLGGHHQLHQGGFVGIENSVPTYNNGHLNLASSNLYQQMVTPPQQHKRVAAGQPIGGIQTAVGGGNGIGSAGRPLSSQLPVIQRKTGQAVDSALDAASALATASSEPKVSVVAPGGGDESAGGSGAESDETIHN